MDLINRTELKRDVIKSLRKNPHTNPDLKQNHYLEHNHFLSLISRQATVEVTEKWISRDVVEKILDRLMDKVINSNLEAASCKDRNSVLARCADAQSAAYLNAIKIIKEEVNK